MNVTKKLYLLKRPLLITSLLALTSMMATSTNARPPYAVETGAQCAFCHVGPMANKQFTSNGKAWCQYLKNEGRIPKQKCKMTTIKLYDQQGKFVKNHMHCVPYGPPPLC